jgi:Ca2+-binding EF-hand superfamily protein
MKTRFMLSGALALGLVALAPGRSIAVGKQTGSPGPIHDIQDVQDTAKLLFKLADTNNDGLISQKEAVDAGNLLVGGFFFRADTNGDGVLTPEEARAAREALFQQQPLLRLIVERGKPMNPPQATVTPINQPGQQQQPGEVVKGLAANPGRTIGILLDTNRDKKLEAGELRQAVLTAVQTLFAAADTNQDGQLSPAELNDVVGAAADAAVQSAFQAADLNHNGGLSQAEFDKALTEPAHAVFRVLDANNDGQLSLEELKRAEQIIGDQIRRLRVPEPSNSLAHQLESGGTTTATQPGQAAPLPAAAPGAAQGPGTPRRP